MTGNPLSTAAALEVAIVRPSFKLEAGLGGSFRNNLINESYNVATWPSADFTAFGGVPMRDISGNGFHGTWNGSGVTPGVPFDVPEGLLGGNFTGFGYGQVPTEASPDPHFNLSLAGGDVDIACIVKDVQSTPTEMCIVAKQQGNSVSTGYHVAVQNGHVKFFVSVANIQQVNFESPGSIADGHQHIITCHYLIGPKIAYIFIDGVQVASQAHTGLELGLTTGPLRVGLFSADAVGDNSGFKGTLGYVSIGREGDITLNARLMATLVWSDLTDDVRIGPNPMQSRIGISGTGPNDHVATSGTFNFTLDNSARKHVNGFYTPGHAGVRTGWELGVPIRWTTTFAGTSYHQFRGRLATVTPLPGIRAGKYVDCQATDWLDVAAGSPLSAMPPQVNQRSDKVLLAAIAMSQGRTPIDALSIHEGQGVFSFAADVADGEGDTILTEIGRVTTSEDGFTYIRSDGTLVFESHGERPTRAISASFNENMSGLEITFSLQQFYNVVRVFYTPRALGVSGILYTLDISQQPQQILAGETRIIEGGYVDPNNKAERVGGANIAPFTPNTDYKFTQNSDGSGSDLTLNLDVQADLGGNSFRLTLTNPSSVDGFLHLTSTVGLQIRGTPILFYSQALEERRNSQSVRERGPRTLSITLPYESRPSRVAQIADDYAALYGREAPRPTSMTVHGNRNATMLTQVLKLQPGDKITVAETMTGVTTLDGFIIHEKSLTYQGGHIVSGTFSLAPASAGQNLLKARLNVMRLGISRLNYVG